MRSFSRLIFGITSLSLLSSFPLTASEELPAREIIRRSVGTNEKDWKAGPSFSHQERDIETKGDEKIDRTWEVFLMNGSPYRRLVAVDGQPLTPAHQKQEKQREGRELASRRSETPAQRAARIEKYQREREQDHVLMIQMEVAFDFRLIGEDTLSGHPVYVLDAEPKADYIPPNHETKVLTGMRGKLWVDKSQYHWAKVEAEVFHPVTFAGFLARVGPGTKFVLEKQPVNSEIWQPTKFEDDVVASILFFGHNSKIAQTFMDYRPNGAISGVMRRDRTFKVELQRKEVEQVLQGDDGNQLSVVHHQ